MAYGAYKDLPRKTASDDEAYAIASTPKYDQYQRGLASIVYKFFDKNLELRGTTTNEGTGIISEDQQLANELCRPITRKFGGAK